MIDITALESSLKEHTVEELRQVSEERIESVLGGNDLPLSAGEAKRRDLIRFGYPHGAFIRLCATLYAEGGMNPRTALTRALIEANGFEHHEYLSSFVLRHPNVLGDSENIQIECRLADRAHTPGDRRNPTTRSIEMKVGEERKPKAMKELVGVMLAEFFRREPFSHYNNTTSFRNSTNDDTLSVVQLLRHIESKAMNSHFMLLVERSSIRLHTNPPALHDLGSEVWEHDGGGHLNVV